MTALCGRKRRKYRRAGQRHGHKRKTRPGGQPDGSSHMGAWGGWALAPNTASMGRDCRSHIDWSRKVRRTFKAVGEFFNFSGRLFGRRNYCAAGFGSPAAGFSDALAAAGRARALVVETSCRSGAVSVAGLSETSATGPAGVVEAAETAA
jgi:hypothetical protein